MRKWDYYDDEVEYDVFGNESITPDYSNKEDWEIESEEFLKYMDDAFPGWSDGL